MDSAFKVIRTGLPCLLGRFCTPAGSSHTVRIPATKSVSFDPAWQLPANNPCWGAHLVNSASSICPLAQRPLFCCLGFLPRHRQKPATPASGLCRLCQSSSVSFDTLFSSQPFSLIRRRRSFFLDSQSCPCRSAALAASTSTKRDLRLLTTKNLSKNKPQDPHPSTPVDLHHLRNPDSSSPSGPSRPSSCLRHRDVFRWPAPQTPGPCGSHAHGPPRLCVPRKL